MAGIKPKGDRYLHLPHFGTIVEWLAQLTDTQLIQVRALVVPHKIRVCSSVVEQRAVNSKVVGSNPSLPALKRYTRYCQDLLVYLHSNKCLAARVGELGRSVKSFPSG